MKKPEETIYSLFHQVLGVAFFQFARSLFKTFEQNFYRIIFSYLPNFPGKIVDFCCVLWKLDYLACNIVFKITALFSPLS